MSKRRRATADIRRHVEYFALLQRSFAGLASLDAIYEMADFLHVHGIHLPLGGQRLPLLQTGSTAHFHVGIFKIPIDGPLLAHDLAAPAVIALHEIQMDAAEH